VVTHTVDGRRRYTKVVRPERLPALLATLEVVADTSPVRVPAVLGSDPAHGSMTVAELPGRTLHDLLADLRADHATLRAAGVATGRAVRLLHGAPARAGRPVQDAAAELRVVHGWTGVAATHGLLRLPHTSVAVQLERMAGLLAGLPPNEALLHRDLHDKQILIADEVGLLDLDLAAVGHPALDLANLQVHLELRVHQGIVTPERALACVEGVIEGYAPDPTVTAAMRGYGLATRLRLLAVYAFRPHGTSAALRLITHPLFKETS
jgi:aminoglycoside phosphotransferase (APT) family kinase protein